MNRNLSLSLSLLIGILSIVASKPVAAVELITNGDFETGTLAGWTVTNQAGGTGDFFIDTPGTTAPLSGNVTAANATGGSFYAVTDQTGPGTHALEQSFTVPAGSGSVILSFQMFVATDSAAVIGPAGLDFGGDPNQHARVDILSAGSGALDTGAGVLQNFYLGVDGPTGSSYVNYSFDITALVGAGGTFELRFAEVDNQNFLNQGVDNVSVNAVATVVPEASTNVLLATGILPLLTVAILRRRK